MDALQRLQQLSIVSKVCVELENNCGINDQTVGMITECLLADIRSGVCG
jgi:hypothetical protein